MEKKYKLTDDTIQIDPKILYRIQAIKDFGNVRKGDIGGWVEKEENLSHIGDCWVYGNAEVYDVARVFGNAFVSDNAVVCGNAEVCNNAEVFDNAVVRGSANVCGNAKVYDNAKIYGFSMVFGNADVGGNADVCYDALINNRRDYIVFKNWWSSGRHFTWTRSNNMWKVGCFYGTGQELIDKAYSDSKESGMEYERIVNYVQDVLGEPHLHRTYKKRII